MYYYSSKKTISRNQSQKFWSLPSKAERQNLEEGPVDREMILWVLGIEAYSGGIHTHDLIYFMQTTQWWGVCVPRLQK